MIEQLQTASSTLIDRLYSILDGLVMLLPNIILASVVAVLGFLSVRALRRKLRKGLVKRMSNTTMAAIISRVVAFILMAALLFLILGLLNLDKLLTSLLATAGVVGLAVGLALQEPLANAFGGVMLSMRKLYRIGDLVETNDHFGVIKEVNLRSTIIHEPSGQVVSLPNRLVLENPLTNYSFSGKRRVELDVGVSYAEDLDQVETIARSALGDISDISSIEFYYLEFGDSSINLRVRFWIDEVSQSAYYRAKSSALRAIKQAFDEHEILIPFPIRTLDFGIKGGQKLSSEVNQLSINHEIKDLLNG